MSAREDYPYRESPYGPERKEQHEAMVAEIDRLREEHAEAMRTVAVVGSAYHRVMVALDSIAERQVPTVLREFRSGGTSLWMTADELKSLTLEAYRERFAGQPGSEM